MLVGPRAYAQDGAAPGVQGSSVGTTLAEIESLSQSAPRPASGAVGGVAGETPAVAPQDAPAGGTEAAGADETSAVDEEECGDACCPGQNGTLEFFGPLAVINQHPPNLLFLSPAPEAATVLAPGRQALTAKLDYTNVIIREWDNGTIIDYDFEGLRASTEYRRGLRRGEAWAALPVYYRGHGVLDHIISSWHNLLGLPNGLRKRFPDNQYRYTIITRQGLVFNDEGDTYGLGDLALGYKYPLWNRRGGGDAAALRAMAKLPLGRAASGLGSGDYDCSLGALYQHQITPHLRGYANVDWVFVGQPDWQNVGHQDMLISNWIVEYAVSPATTVLSQYRINVNPLRTGSKEADKDAQELAFAFNHRLKRNLVWSGGFVEDINPETAPDLVLVSHFKWEF